MDQVKHEVIKLAKLKRMFSNEVFGIPDIQRNYIWDKKRILALADSIVRGYPIGVFLVWKTSSKISGSIKLNKQSIIPTASLKNSNIQYIIDGQQRLTTLYGILNGKETFLKGKPFNFKLIVLNFNNNGDLNNEICFKYIPHNEYDISSGVTLFDVLNFSSDRIKVKYKLSNKKMNSVNLIKNSFKNYNFFSLQINSNKLDDVQETFVRINSQGMTVDKADKLFAQMTSVNLRDLVDSLKNTQTFKDTKYNEVRPESILYSLALDVTGMKEIGEGLLSKFAKIYENDSKACKDFQNNWKKYSEAFSNAIAFLSDEFMIDSFNELPSTNIFTMISYFFIKLGKKRPSTNQVQTIKRWFWHTGLGDRYSGRGFNSNIQKDIDFFNKLILRPNMKYFVDEKISSREFFLTSFTTGKSSQAETYRLFLKSCKPLYFENGRPMNFNTSHIKNRRDKHHIFPRDYLQNRKVNKRLINCISNMCLLSANENQSIGKNPPKEYPDKFQNKKHFRKVLKSHFIVKEGISEKDIKVGFRDFINSRNRTLKAEISKKCQFAKNELFTELDEIKRVI